MEKIQMTEEQAREILKRGMFGMIIVSESIECSFIDKLKQAGYIIKNLAEEAEWMYNAYKTGNDCYVAITILDKQHEAIIYLQEEIKKLRG